MNANARKWVEALRSGEFKQTTGRLRRNDGFCCLGVLCEVYRRETGGGEWIDYGGLPAFQVSVPPAATYGQTHPPREVIAWVGLANDCGDSRGDERPLTDQNDSGATFGEIADVIESEPEGLFA